MRGLRELDGGLGIVMIAKKADLDDAVRAMQAGVLDYFVGKMDTALATRLEQAVGAGPAAAVRAQHVRSGCAGVCRDVNAHIPRGPVSEPARSIPNWAGWNASTRSVGC